MNLTHKPIILHFFPNLIPSYTFSSWSSSLPSPILHPWWFTGFSDGDGCFSASAKFKPNNRISFQPSFSISQHSNNFFFSISTFSSLWSSLS